MNDIDKLSREELTYPLKNAHRTAKAMKGLDKLLAKYESVKEQMLVMDDYDGGMMHMAELIITDLKKLKKLLDISEKSGIV